MDFRLAPQAESELDEVWYFLATQSSNVDAADRMVNSIAENERLIIGAPERRSPVSPWARFICGVASAISKHRLPVNAPLSRQEVEGRHFRPSGDP